MRTWDNRKGIDAERLGQHVVQSLAIRRDCHAIGSLLGGKLPHTVGIVPGGATGHVTQELKTQLATIASRIRAFVDGIYRSDVEAVALAFPECLDIGASRCNFLSLGGSPPLSGALLLSPGVVREPLGESSPVVADASRITESVASSRLGDHPRVCGGHLCPWPPPRPGARPWKAACRRTPSPGPGSSACASRRRPGRSLGCPARSGWRPRAPASAGAAVARRVRSRGSPA